MRCVFTAVYLCLQFSNGFFSCIQKQSDVADFPRNVHGGAKTTVIHDKDN